jgi:phosphatidylserine/phosphatidylglycerophosphate/cardiolipin synthase-like enzyme
MTTSIEDAVIYRQFIERIADSQLNQRIPNGKPAHAAILFETMFKKAKDTVRIFTGDLSREAYGTQELLQSAKSAVQRGVTVQILLQHKKDRAWMVAQPLIETAMYNGSLPSNIEVRCAIEPYSSSTKHFAVMDHVGYRFEVDHDHCKAFANFNEPVAANNLARAFDGAFSAANRLSLQ